MWWPRSGREKGPATCRSATAPSGSPTRPGRSARSTPSPAVLRSHRFDHPLQALAAGSGTVLVGSTRERPRGPDRRLEGNVLKLLTTAYQLKQRPAPCVREPGVRDRGRDLRPPARAPGRRGRGGGDAPAGGRDGGPGPTTRRDVHVHIRPGFKFSPPRTRRSPLRPTCTRIERALAPTMGDQGFAGYLVGDIEGEDAFVRGRPPHSAGSGRRATRSDHADGALARLPPAPVDATVLPGADRHGRGAEARTVELPGRRRSTESHRPAPTTSRTRSTASTPSWPEPRLRRRPTAALRLHRVPGERRPGRGLARVRAVLGRDRGHVRPAARPATPHSRRSSARAPGDGRTTWRGPARATTRVPGAERRPGRRSTTWTSAGRSPRRSTCRHSPRLRRGLPRRHAPKLDIFPPHHRQPFRPPYPTDGPDLNRAEAAHARGTTGTRPRRTVYDPGCGDCAPVGAGAVKEQPAPDGIHVQLVESNNPFGRHDGPPEDYEMRIGGSGPDWPDLAFYLSLLVTPVPSPVMAPGADARRRSERWRAENDEAAGEAGPAPCCGPVADAVPAMTAWVRVSGLLFSPGVGCRVFPPFGIGVALAELCPGEKTPTPGHRALLAA